MDYITCITHTFVCSMLLSMIMLGERDCGELCIREEEDMNLTEILLRIQTKPKEPYDSK